MKNTELIIEADIFLESARRLLKELDFSTKKGDPNVHDQQIALTVGAKTKIAASLELVSRILERER